MSHTCSSYSSLHVSGRRKCYRRKMPHFSFVYCHLLLYEQEGSSIAGRMPHTSCCFSFDPVQFIGDTGGAMPLSVIVPPSLSLYKVIFRPVLLAQRYMTRTNTNREALPILGSLRPGSARPRNAKPENTGPNHTTTGASWIKECSFQDLENANY